jgi:cytochrome c oxidase cbb3-type subunit I/II
MTVDVATDSSHSFQDRPVGWFLFATAFWGLVAAIGAMVLALLLVAPKLFYELGDSAQHFSFGRLFPLQMQITLFGFLANGFFAFAYFAVQRLERVRLALAPLATVHFVSWQILIIAAVVSAVGLKTEGRWLNWMEPSFVVAMLAVWILLFAVVIGRTLSRRASEQRLSVPVWFVLAVVMAVPVVLLLGNGAQMFGANYEGVQDVMMQWWSSRGLVTFLMSVPAVGMLYFLVPSFGSGRIHSHRLSVIHFWSIAILGCWGGNFPWHFTALPEWINSIAMFAGMFLWLGCLAGSYNLWQSLPRSVAKAERSVVLRLTTAAIVCYALYAIDSAFMSLRQSTLTVQFTDWATANQWLAIFGVSGLTLIAFSLWVLPVISNVEVNPMRGGWLRWLAIEGAVFQVIALYVAGLTQSFSWNRLNELGRLEYPEFVTAITWVQPLWIAVVVGTAGWLLAMVYWMLMLLRPTLLATASHHSIASLPVGRIDEPVVVPSSLAGAPVLGLAIGLQQWGQLAWHSRLERRPASIAFRLAVALVIGTMLVWLPSLLYRGPAVMASSVTQSPYTELELLGRELYVREGCVACHTQAARPLVPEVLRYGSHSQASDYAFDEPVQIGFRRVGPDLAREGGRQSSLWQWNHLENPQNVTPESVMPAFDYLLNQRLDTKKSPEMSAQAESIAADIVGAGGPVLYGDDLLMNSKGIALIAYLQRLGVVTANSPNAPDTN